MLEVQKILIAYDGSEQSLKALEWAIKIIKQNQAKLTIATVLTPPIVYSGFDQNSGMMLGPLWEIAEEESKKVLEHAEQLCVGEGVAPYTILLHGIPDDEIIKYAHQENFDLIICGTRGLGGFEGLLLGSVAQKLVTYAKIPVLVVK